MNIIVQQLMFGVSSGQMLVHDAAIGARRRPTGGLDGVEETNNIRVGRIKLVPRTERLKSQEQKVPDDILVVVLRPVEAGNNVGHPQLFLCVLQQRDKGSLAAVRKLILGDTDVEPALPEYSLPLGPNSALASGREADLNSLLAAILLGEVSPKGGGCPFQKLSLGVRGMSFVPRADALWEFPTCAGDIKPAVEAPRRGC